MIPECFLHWSKLNGTRVPRICVENKNIAFLSVLSAKSTAISVDNQTTWWYRKTETFLVFPLKSMHVKNTSCSSRGPVMILASAWQLKLTNCSPRGST